MVAASPLDAERRETGYGAAQYNEWIREFWTHGIETRRWSGADRIPAEDGGNEENYQS